MKRALAVAITVLVALSALPALSSVSGAQSVPAPDERSGSERSADDRRGTWIGEIDGTDVAVAVISDGTLVRAYTCDGGVVSAWFEGELVGNSFSISTEDGSTITGALADDTATGLFTSTDGPFSGSFTANRPTAGGGVFRSYFVTEEGAPTFIRWIVFDDGSQRGNSETTTAAGTETTSAPPLPAPEARVEGTAPVGPAAAPAPVTELTPTSISKPVPTTQIAGAPPPIPPSAPPTVQPLAVTGKVTPAKAEVNAPVRYQLTLTNPNRQPLTGVGVRVGLPPGLAVRANTDRTTCKGTFAAFPPGTSKPGAPHLVVSAVALAAGASCTADVDIVGAAPTAVDVVTDAPTASGAPPGVPARATFVIGSTVAAPAAPPTTRPGATTTTTKPPATTTTAPRAGVTNQASRPGPPSNVRGRPLVFRANDSLVDGGRIELTFDAPADPGGTPVDDFVARCRPASSTTGAVTVETRSSPVPLSGLLVGMVHVCTVAARNIAGTGDVGAVEVLIPRPQRPGPPRNVRTRLLDPQPGTSGGRVEVRFDPPSDNGFAEIQDFFVQCRRAFSTDVVTQERTRSPITVTGLETGSDHGCAVVARNRVGSGDATPFDVTVPGFATTPSSPRDLRGEALPLRTADSIADGARIELTFDPPADPGGSSSIDFVAQCTPVGAASPTVRVERPSSPITVSGLQTRRNYECIVAARNSFGTGNPVSVEVPVPGVERPGPPRNVSIQILDPAADGAQLRFSFSPPRNNGGSEVTDFLVQCNPAFDTAPTTIFPKSSPATMTGLRTGTEHSCVLQARNRVGAGTVVEINATTRGPGPAAPRSRPSAPRDVQAEEQPLRTGEGTNAGRILLHFEPPADNGGSEIVRYEAACLPTDPEAGVFPESEGEPDPFPGPTIRDFLVVTRVPVGVEFLCQVNAINQAGRVGEVANARNRVTVSGLGEPSPPRDVRARALPFTGGGRNGGPIEVTFTPPATNGGSKVVRYEGLCVSQTSVDELSVSEFAGPGTPLPGDRVAITVQGVRAGIPHACDLSAVNLQGFRSVISKPSNVVTVAFADPPGAPIEVEARALPARSGDGRTDARVEVGFFPPDNNGGARITRFDAVCLPLSAEDDPTVAASGADSPIPLTGLAFDVPYRCFASATNVGGTGPSGDAPRSVVVESATPSVPRQVEARALPPRSGDGLDDGRIEVSLTPPAREGGARVTEFTGVCLPRSAEDDPVVSASDDRLPLTITNVPIDVEYQCSAFATNQFGSGPTGDAKQRVTVRMPALAATPPAGSSPLPVTFSLRNSPDVTSWELDFGDGTPKVRGQGAVPDAVPHVYVNGKSQVVTVTPTLVVATSGERNRRFTTTIEVHPSDTVLVVESRSNPEIARRGGSSPIVTFDVRNPNATPLAGTISVAAPPNATYGLDQQGWQCAIDECTLEGGLAGFAKAAPLEALVLVAPDAPATVEATFVVAGPTRFEQVVRIPVAGPLANAGPDQNVDAVTPQPDGSLAPTRVLLDAGASLGLSGDQQSIDWRRVSGPRVNLDTSDPTGRIATFDAPAAASPTLIEFELAITEGRERSTDRVVVTVAPRNQPPVLRRINVRGLNVRPSRSGGEIIPEGSGTLTFEPDASDPDSDDLTTTWRVLTPGVQPPAASGKSFSLQWPVQGVAQIVVEGTVTDPRGAVDSATVTIGVPPEPLELAVNAPARVASGEPVTARAIPSRTSGVDVRWTVSSGPQPAGFPHTGSEIRFDAPDVETTAVTVLEVTATERATGATATRQVAIEVQAGVPLSLSVPPAVSVDTGEAVAIEAAVDGQESRTLEWTQTFGPDVQLRDASTRTVRFDAPGSQGTIGLRLTANVGGTSVSANTVVTVGEPLAAPAGGCSAGSAYQRFVDGEPVVLGGGLVVITGHSVQGANDECDEATLSGVDVILADGLVVGDNLGGTVDEDRVRLTEGAVRVPPSFQLPDIELGGAPLEIAFDGGAESGGDPCISWDGTFSSSRFPFVPLPPGFTGAGARIVLTCTSLSLTAEATAGGATFTIDADLSTDGSANATVTLESVPVLGGTASGSGTVAVAPGGAASYDLSATIADPELPIPGIDLASASARLTPAGLSVTAEGTLGQGSGALGVSMDGAFAETGLSLVVEARSAAPWEVGTGLTVEAANLVGTIDVDAQGTATVDLRLAVGGDWRPVPGLRVRNLSLQVANTGVPVGCEIPSGGMWVRVEGEGAIEIAGVSPVTLAVEACLGPPTGTDGAAFSLRSTIGGAPWALAPGVVIRDVAIEVVLVGGELTLRATGSATLLGLDLTASVAFLIPSGGGQPTIVVDAAGDLTGIGIPIPEAHVVFASAAVSDFELAPGLTIDLPQGITGVGTIDLGQPIADLLNEAFSPPTPILPTVTVTISFGTTIEIKAAINLGGEGATLFIGCPGGGTSCDPTAPTTTRLALTSAFIRLVIGGAGGFSIGFGGDGTLQLPPAEDGGAASLLDLHVEASIQPPARVSLAMFFEGALQNAMGLQGLTLSNLGIQGSIDFSTTPVPLVTIGVTGQVDRVPDQLAEVLGLTNNGEPMRFTLNVDPLAPILELTLGVDNGQIVARPLAALGQADALEVDFASVVVAPLGGTVGPVTYSPGISAGFRANILGVPVNVNASVDLAAAHLNGTVEVGALTIGGVRFEDTTILVDITPASFRQTLCGGVHIGNTTLQGLLHIQAGAGGGGPATCGGVSLAPGSGAGLRARFRLNAASLPVGPVNIQQFSVDAQAELDALSANFNATLNVTGRIDVLANSLSIDGSVRFDSTGVKELHVKALGNVNVAGVQLTGGGTCPFAQTAALGPRINRGGGRSAPTGSSASGACVQLDHAPGTSTPFRFGLKGKLTAAGSTASVTGSIDASRANLSGTLNVPTLGNLDVSGTLVFGGGATIANATGANVNASPGDWRVSGRFGSNRSLAGGVFARWSFVAGRVSGGLFVRGSADASIGGAIVQLAGTFSSSGGNLTYSLTGSSTATVDSSVNLGEVNAIHTAVRGLFVLPGQRASDERVADVARGRFTRGRLYFTASYAIDATLTQSGLDIDEADLSARVRYAERFRNRPDQDDDGFQEESQSRWNTIVNFNVDASGIDEFFEMAVGEAATRTRAAGFCFTVLGTEFGAC
jgi:hypothetical protein